MAMLDPYTPCPCGSGEKLKWCCPKSEDAAIRVERHIRNEQFDQALKAAQDGLKRAKESPWLLLQLAYVQSRLENYAEAMEAVDQILKKRPDHVGALQERVQLVATIKSPEQAVITLQEAMTTCKAEDRPRFWMTFRFIGFLLTRTENLAAAIAHLEIGSQDEPESNPIAQRMLNSIRVDSQVSPWLKCTYDLLEPPEGLESDQLESFQAAIVEADEGLWARAAARFKQLANEGIAESIHNFGLCCVWLANPTTAIKALRDYIRRLGPTTKSVDLEALCQLIEPLRDDDKVEQVRLVWALSDREGLRKTLHDASQARREVAFQGSGPLDPSEPESTEAEIFALLKPIDSSGPNASQGDVILREVVARIFVGEDTVELEGFDRGREIDTLRERFLQLAGTSIPPAHPKTKSVSFVSGARLALKVEWVVPSDSSGLEVRRRQAEEQRRILTEVWPSVPNPSLGYQTPREAAKRGGDQIALRAAFCLLESESNEAFRLLTKLRDELGVPPEPTPDLNELNTETEHPGRYDRLPIEELDDERLWGIHERSRLLGLQRAVELSASALIKRPKFFEEREPEDYLDVVGILADAEAVKNTPIEAISLIDRYRASEPESLREANAPRWDFLRLRYRSRLEPPESWVPELAAILERYRDRENKQTSGVVLENLIEMGVVQVTPDPEKPGQMLVDTRPLASLLAQYGPQIATATGEVGVSATKPAIWTPEQSRSTSSGIWTPGSTDKAEPQKKIILPGS